jgi:hypothetical protein
MRKGRRQEPRLNLDSANPSLLIDELYGRAADLAACQGRFSLQAVRFNCCQAVYLTWPRRCRWRALSRVMCLTCLGSVRPRLLGELAVPAIRNNGYQRGQSKRPPTLKRGRRSQHVEAKRQAAETASHSRPEPQKARIS